MSTTARDGKRLTLGSLGMLTAALTAGHADEAAAATINISQQLTLGAALQAPGGSVSGAFDISSLLNLGPNEQFTVVSASLTAYAFSEAVSQTAVSSTAYSPVSYFTFYAWASYTYYVPYSCGYSWSSQTCYYAATGYYSYPVQGTEYQRDVTTNVTDSVVDQLTILAGGDALSGQVSQSVADTGFGPRIYEGGSYSAYNYRRERTLTSLYSGGIDAQGAVGAAALFELATTQGLAFSVQQNVGKSVLDWIRLDVVVETTPVPLPGAALLLGSGLGVLGAAARRVRRKRV